MANRLLHFIVSYYYCYFKMGQFFQFLKKGFVEPEIYPLVGVLGVAFSAAAYMGLHQARAPDVVWDHKKNETPWQQVNQGDQVKLAAYNQKYDRKFVRKEW
ncbi:uncharacterized protein B0P05DRAFT_525792 [Gilbertella persicaria]|uniref:uncharacterized protein n=1 Tax=Gilbertella persicaria TaxID=101096 RepID=UPI002220DE0A|nr:uncharacterized protein B0P05DRAFT_525792 [Gilbertella persicaria]KAI8092318.1 hypothetical protein B0P05DRAFT_525792 [Gilbertella persicaria]